MESVSDATETNITGEMSAPALLPPNVATPDMAAQIRWLIDVVKDFQWTASPKQKYIVEEMPNIILREYNVIGNAIQQQAKYMLEFGTSNALMGAAVGGAIGGKIFGGAGAAAGALVGGAAGLVRGGFSLSGGRKGYLQPYVDLYAIRPTGFVYRMPFIEENYRTVTTNWGAVAASSGTVGKMYNALRSQGINIATDAATVFNEPNAFIEESKQYQHDTDGSPISFKFFLSNTGSYEDVIRNWHLTYMLQYQNLPNRSSKVLVRPPAIYEVNIPGVMYHPFCSISSLSINHLGAQRETSIDVNVLLNAESSGEVRLPGGGGGTQASSIIKTIIPDAYSIEFSIMPLVKETQNFLYHTTTRNDAIYDIKIKDEK